MNNAEIITQDKAHFLPLFKRFPVAITKGKGSKVWDADGREYLDALSGIAVAGTGHCHPHVVNALQEQAANLMHISNFFATPQQAKLAETLTKKSGLARAFNTNSGAESNEGAIKFARKYAYSKNRGGHLITFENCFHGRTLATIAAGGKKMQKGFAPIPEGFKQAQINNEKSVKDLIDDNVAGIIIEPVLGEGGVLPVSDDFLLFLRKLCDDNDMVLIFDEVQCGIARTGSLFAFQQTPVKPDILSLAKGLGSGFPVGAVLCNNRITDALDFGDHGTTFGGNPLACAAVLATLDVIENEKLEKAAKEKGQFLMQTIEDKLGEHPLFGEVRGKGLMVGVVLQCDAKPIVLKMLELGVIANATAENVVRLVPALTIEMKDIEKIVQILLEAIELVVQEKSKGYNA